MHMPASKNLHVLTKIRKHLRLSQQGLAKDVGVHWRTIQDVECGKRKLSYKLASDISDATGVSQEWLLANNAKREPINRDGKKYRFSYDREKVQLSRTEWTLYSKLKRGHALAICSLLFKQYRVHRCLLDRLPNTAETWFAFGECINDSLTKFLQEYPAAREAWPSDLWKDSPWVVAHNKALKDVWSDVKALIDFSKEPEIPEMLRDEQAAIELLQLMCRTPKERVQAIKFIRNIIDKEGRQRLDSMSLLELKTRFRRTLSSSFNLKNGP
jgi:DNA-binding XRE family transcriptional regulator